MNLRLWGMMTLIFCISCWATPAAGQTPNHINPPHWWSGFETDSVTVLFHAPGIGTSECLLSTPVEGVDLVRVEQVTSPNYAFVTFRFAADFAPAAPVRLPLVFRGDRGRVVARHDYEIRPRLRAAADIRGYDNGDVLCLITPDRFANGDPSNDNIPGMGDPVDRSDDHGRHGGDIAGIRQHLDYLEGMGFTAVWLNPLLENKMPESSYHGYATTDFYAVDARFGSNADYVALADDLRARGMKLVMDMILNHCGSEHWWMNDLPDPDWIHQHDPYLQTNHRRTTLRDPHAAASDRDAFLDGWFVPTMPDLNQQHPLMANYLIQNSLWWIETLGLGGIRMDTYPYSDPAFLSDWSCAVMREYPNFNICGEEWSMNPAVLAYWQAGANNLDGYTSCLPGLLDFPLQKALVESVTRESAWESTLLPLYEMLSNDFLYADPDANVIFPDNHDMSRIATQLGDDPDLVKLALTFFATTRGTPTFYYGTEVFMSNTGNNSHGNIRSDFPGGWPGDEVNGFTGEGLAPEALDIQQYMRVLLNWRQSARALHGGELIHFAPRDKEDVYVYVRRGEGQTVLVMLNAGAEDVTLPASRYAEVLPRAMSGTDVLRNEKARWDPALSVEVGGRSALVWSFETPGN